MKKDSGVLWGGWVTRPDKLKEEDKLLNKWKVSGTVLQVVSYKCRFPHSQIGL